jgi:hypothetical protein
MRLTAQHGFQPEQIIEILAFFPSNFPGAVLDKPCPGWLQRERLPGGPRAYRNIPLVAPRPYPSGALAATR